MTPTFFDILGIDTLGSAADQSAAAAKLWPPNFVLLTSGYVISLGDPTYDTDAPQILQMLQGGLSFKHVRSGTDADANLGAGGGGQISFSADVDVSGPAVGRTLYLAAMPDVGIQLVQTDPQQPAHVFFCADGRGHELIIDKLLVKIFLKAGTASPIGSAAVTVGDVDPTAIDTFQYKLVDELTPAEITCYVRLQLTPEGDVILEPAVPISLGPCRWMGLPATAVYDIALIPSPNRREYYEWARNDLGSFFSNPPAKGAIGFRSLDIDFSQPPFSDLHDRIQAGSANLGDAELVLEDVVMPVTVPVLPVPSHGTFGFRRKVEKVDDIKAAFSFDAAPLQISLYSSGKQGGSGGNALTLEVNSFQISSGDPHSIDPDRQPQLLLDMSLVWQRANGRKLAGRIALEEQWTVAIGIVFDATDSPPEITFIGLTIRLVGIRFGISIQRLIDDKPFQDSFELLLDLFLVSKPSKPSAGDEPFKVESLTGKPLATIFYDVGWKLGSVSFRKLSIPDGLSIKFAGKFQIIIEEFGWVEEPNGTAYFSFSGGIALGKAGGQRAKPVGDASDEKGNGFGIRVRRLRFRLNDDETQAKYKVDGLFLNLSYPPTVTVEGFGVISDRDEGEWKVREWGFGAKVELNALAMKFSLSAEFFKGSRRRISNSDVAFDYFLAALDVGFLPAGPIGLYDIRALVADNLAPNLDATFPDGEGMALYKWHQNHDAALSIVGDRAMADWMPEDDAFSLGVGCGFSLNGCGAAIHLTIFIFFSKSAADTGLLVVGELFLLKNPKPIAWVAIEYDIDKEKFGVMVGVDLTISSFFPSTSVPDWISKLVTLSGTLYFGNQPWSFAVGQLADQSTWLSLKAGFDFLVEFKLVIGVCVQVVDGGPRGFGFVFSAKGTAIWGIGGFTLWFSFTIIVGTWKTGADTSGCLFAISAGLKIKVFWIFSFGAEINMQVDYLGKTPWYTHVHAEVKIDTPWFLPDVTFSFDKHYQQSLPFDVATLTRVLARVAALDPTLQKAIDVVVPGLSNGETDAARLYTFNALSALNGTRINDPRGITVTPVSVDSTLLVDFSQPVANDSALATTTAEPNWDPGAQTVKDIQMRYGLESLSIRRAPRFGPSAGMWTDLLTDAQTSLTVGGAAPQTVPFAWDLDSRADGHLEPKRLLINTATPYSLVTSSPRNDEEALQNDPSFPCCTPAGKRSLYPKPHVLEFSAFASGSRTGRNQRFDGANGEWWRWSNLFGPTVSFGAPNYPGQNVARLFPRGSVNLGTVDFSAPAASAQITLAWDAMPGSLFFEAYSGLTLVQEQTISTHIAGSTSMQVQPSADASVPITRLALRANTDLPADGATDNARALRSNPLASLAVLEINYITIADALAYAGAGVRCPNPSNVGPTGSDGRGKLAFLANHVYEVVVNVAVDLGTKTDATRRKSLQEAFYFRTKGLPGLNFCANTGDDLRPHVDGTYPMRIGIPLYRTEPCVLTFKDTLSSLLPIDRIPAITDPPEKAQIFPLELNVDRVTSANGMRRLTVPGDDWISAHRTAPPPPVIAIARSGGFATTPVRRAPSLDPGVLRHEAIKTAVAQRCGPPKLDHPSQVLMHAPIGPNATAGPWEATTAYRATARRQNGPYAELGAFDASAMTAFTTSLPVNLNLGRLAALNIIGWSTNRGQLIGPTHSDGDDRFAIIGESDWDHLQVQSRIDLGAAQAAGIAVGIGDGEPIPQAIIATVEVDGAGHLLVLRAHYANNEVLLASAPLTLKGPVTLVVTAFDDRVRATAGDVSIDADRGSIREGRLGLVTNGPAAFGGISVNALDLYTFDFNTSRYESFVDHMSSFDGTLPVLVTGSFGVAVPPAASVIATVEASLVEVMNPAADPQQRQQVFDAALQQLGIGLRKDPDRVTIDRLCEGANTFGFLLQSPEPISLTRDVTLTMTVQTLQWVPGPMLPTPPIPFPPVLQPGGLAGVLADAMRGSRPAPSADETMAAIPHPTQDMRVARLAGVRFGVGVARLPAGSMQLNAGESLIRVVTNGGVQSLELFKPTRNGEITLAEIIPIAQALGRADLAPFATLPVNSVGIVESTGALGPILLGHWITVDVPVELSSLANGDETCLLLLAKTGLLFPSLYTLHGVLDRDRWVAASPGDAAQHYHDECVVQMHW